VDGLAGEGRTVRAGIRRETVSISNEITLFDGCNTLLQFAIADVHTFLLQSIDIVGHC
jgi:hypothetical protein